MFHPPSIFRPQYRTIWWKPEQHYHNGSFYSNIRLRDSSDFSTAFSTLYNWTQYVLYIHDEIEYQLNIHKLERFYLKTIQIFPTESVVILYDYGNKPLALSADNQCIAISLHCLWYPRLADEDNTFWFQNIHIFSKTLKVYMALECYWGGFGLVNFTKSSEGSTPEGQIPLPVGQYMHRGHSNGPIETNFDKDLLNNTGDVVGVSSCLYHPKGQQPSVKSRFQWVKHVLIQHFGTDSK
jgi:hypothetical protein